MKADLIKAFTDPSILNDNIYISVINQRGEKEEGFGSGVYRDVLSTFWYEVYESLISDKSGKQLQGFWFLVIKVTSISQYFCLKHFLLILSLERALFLWICY